ncbi:Endothelin-converting enzyme 2 [Acipenser ruthenus]|uniref:Endothelin-converting enzyme 2 n=1 Tax=Acipenser ruthenus TaxID=7906 RepID=A0A662YTE3_ACIRT|nr:Endothelin-converting enzyme 2 [Acipenser ruthenus]
MNQAFWAATCFEQDFELLETEYSAGTAWVQRGYSVGTAPVQRGYSAGVQRVGCGNSSMSSDMHSCGFTSITNIDYSAVCIKAMAARHRGCPGMDWRQMDARLLTFAEGSFDVVLEKETLNAMMVEEKEPWRVSPETGETVRQVSRVLKPGGRFISITFAQPHFRKQRHAWEEFGWSVRHDAYGSGFHYFLYVMIKGEALSPEE